MQNPHKKPYKGFYAKAKPHAQDNFEYDSFEPSSYQNHYYSKHHNSYKYSKPKKYYPEYTYQPIKNQPTQPHKQSGEDFTAQAKVFEHNEKSIQEETTNVPKGQIISSETPVNKEVSQPRYKGDKKPEKALYSARRKYAKVETTKNDSKTAASTEASTQSLDSGISEDKGITDVSITVEIEKKRDMTSTGNGSGEKDAKKANKERLPSEEDKSFVSNVSTAISEKTKTCEDESSAKEKAPVPETRKKGKKSNGRILFQIMLESEGCMEKVRIFEDEEDYDTMLDRVCKSHNLRGSMGLYFKINMLKSIYDMHPDKTKVEPALKKNVALNAKLIMFEHGMQEVDDSIRSLLSYSNASFC